MNRMLRVYNHYFACGNSGELLWWARLSVCLSVREAISGTTRAIFTNSSVHVAYGRGSVLLRQGNEIPRGMGSFGGFPPHWQCTVRCSLQMGTAGKGVTGVHSVGGEVWSTIALLRFAAQQMSAGYSLAVQPSAAAECKHDISDCCRQIGITVMVNGRLSLKFTKYHTTHHNRFMALFPGPPGWAGARGELLDFMVQGKINRGRHTDHPAGRHSIRTNQCPPPLSPHIFFTDWMPFLPPNQQHQSTEGCQLY